MKKITFLLILSAFTLSAYSQQALSKDDYMRKSRNKKTAGFVFLGAGAAMITTGLLLQSGNSDLNTLTQDITAALITGTGILSAVISIPFFVSSVNNKQKALAVSFKNETTRQFSGNAIAVLYYPAVSFKIRL